MKNGGIWNFIRLCEIEEVSIWVVRKLMMMMVMMMMIISKEFVAPTSP